MPNLVLVELIPAEFSVFIQTEMAKSTRLLMLKMNIYYFQWPMGINILCMEAAVHMWRQHENFIENNAAGGERRDTRGRKGRGVTSKGSCATFCRSWFSDSIIFVRNLDLLSLQLTLLLLLLPLLLLLLSLLVSVLQQRFATTNCIINTKMRTCCEVCHLTEKRKVNKNASPADVERSPHPPCGSVWNAACRMQHAGGMGGRTSTSCASIAAKSLTLCNNNCRRRRRRHALVCHVTHAIRIRFRLSTAHSLS